LAVQDRLERQFHGHHLYPQRAPVCDHCVGTRRRACDSLWRGESTGWRLHLDVCVVSRDNQHTLKLEVSGQLGPAVPLRSKEKQFRPTTFLRNALLGAPRKAEDQLKSRVSRQSPISSSLGHWQLEAQGATFETCSPGSVSGLAPSLTSRSAVL
jgi:hypothetical protein